MKTVFVDVDTQIDFAYPAGALYAPGAEKILAAVGKLNRYAAEHGIAQISTVDAHAENDPEFASWPPHCVVGTTGQVKPCETLNGAKPIVFEKQTVNVFDKPGFGDLLKELAADRYVVYGLVTDVCVRNAAFGLLDTGKPVAIVTNAVQAFNAAEGDRTLKEFQAKGGTLTTVEEVISQGASQS